MRSELPPGGAVAAITRWSERWVPDAFVFALAGTVLVCVAGALGSGSPSLVVKSWGEGFWGLLPFTLQMAMVIITGHVLASAPPVHRLIRALSSLPRSPRQAVALVTAFALASAWLNWGFSLIFSAVLAREVARRTRADYRALAAASFLGVGSVWAQGLSGSAALQMASPALLQKETRAIIAHGGLVADGLLPLRHTIFLWQSLASVAVEIALVTLVMTWIAPVEHARTAADLGIDLGDDLGPSRDPASTRSRADLDDARPGAWLERTPFLTLFIVALAASYLVRTFWLAPDRLAAITLDVVNLSALTVGALLHWTPARLMRAVRQATPSVWGVLLQFPFYAGIAGVITGTHLHERLAGVLVRLASPTTLPAVVALYSTVLGVFVPSGGSKWVIEAPYVMQAAHDLHVHLGWMVAVYDLGEALANLVQPFWMLPVLALFGLRARDVMGYTFVVFAVLLPVVLVMVTLLGLTLRYPL